MICVQLSMNDVKVIIHASSDAGSRNGIVRTESLDVVRVQGHAIVI